jgi:hypothetical protein
MWTNPAHVLSDALGADADDVVVVAIGDWTEMRRMQTVNGETRFVQHKESDSEWMITDIFEPDVKNWYAVETYAMGLRLPTPEIAWAGPVNFIPDEILLDDYEVQVRRVDKSEWVNLRKLMKERCVAQA